MPRKPSATLKLIVREDEHDGFAAAALSKEAVFMAVCGGPADCDNRCPELVVESLGPLRIAGHQPAG